ncbi:EAL domain-containing protein [Pseudoxanthomonas gei]|uniref:EAL domain-containing protein n=2 Tax=Pseudoxanthomonas gei TaxID=1383030 RepID=A0ABX0AK19_9GAMM|nr:EAL domain-containing protein [Pseudoxanthomonas gei]
MDVDADRASELRALSGSRSTAMLRLRRLDSLAWLVLALAILLSVWFGYVSWLQARRTAEAQFNARSEAVAAAILTRIHAYEDIVRASAGMLEARPQLDQAGFTAYVTKLQLPQRHPGVQTLGFARRVGDADLPGYVLAQRAQHGPAFDVHPRTRSGEHFIVDLLYPDIPQMRQLLGTDISAEPVRRAALKAARDSGELSAARRVTFGNPAVGGAFSGFLLYAPVYAVDLPHQRNAGANAQSPTRPSLQGFTSAGFGWDRMIQEAIAGVENHQLDLQLQSTDPATGIVYQRTGLRDRYGADMEPAFNQQRTLQFFGGDWKLRISSAPRNVAIPAITSILVLASAGIALGLVVFVLLVTLARADRRSRALLNAVADHLPTLIAYIDHDQCYGFVNRASRDWFEQPSLGWSERRVADVHADNPEFLESLQGAMAKSANGERVSWEARIGQPRRPVQVYLLPDLDADRRVAGWYLMAYDNSEQHRTLRELATARDQLQRVTDKLPAMIAQYDRNEATVFFNRACAEANLWQQPYRQGIRIEEMLGEKTYSLRKPYIDAVMSGRDIDFESVATGADGRPRRLHSYYTPDIDEDGKVCGFFVMSTDLTEKAHLENALYDAHERAEVTLTSISDAVITTDAADRITYMNPAAEALSGWMLHSALGQPIAEILPVHVVGSAAQEEGAHTAAMPGDLQLLRHDGKPILVERSLSPVRDRGTSSAGSVIVLRDITEARALNSRMAYLAHHDALTGLPNRLQLNNSLGKLIDADSSSGDGLAVLFIDLDLFKHVNDALGHHIGDQLLQQVTRRIQRSVGDKGSVYRTGGDEFVVLLDKVSSRERVLEVAQHLLNIGEEPYTVSSHELHQAFSIGISLFPDDGYDASTLMMRADAAMYLAKRSGRNTSRFHNSELASNADARIELENSLRRGLRKGELVLHYQPQIDRISGRIVGVEALMRWQKGDRLMQPGEFLPIAEETHLIVDIDRWAIQAACRQNRIWQQSGLPPIPVSVNIAAANFDTGTLVEAVTAALEDSGMAPEYLELEVTETTIMQDVQRTDHALRALKAMGVRIAIDDFGTGFSSLSYLGNYGFNVLKIDQSFVREVTEPSQAAITRAIIGLASQLDCHTVAEGVETQAQLEWLVANGCDTFQGHLFSPAIPAVEFARLLARGKTWEIPDRTSTAQLHWS